MVEHGTPPVRRVQGGPGARGVCDPFGVTVQDQRIVHHVVHLLLHDVECHHFIAGVEIPNPAGSYRHRDGGLFANQAQLNPLNEPLES